MGNSKKFGATSMSMEGACVVALLLERKDKAC